MTSEEATAVLSSYSPDERKEFIAQLMYELTLVAGDTYEVGDDDDVAGRLLVQVNRVDDQKTDALQVGRLLR